MRQRLREASERSVLLNIIDRESESIEISDLISSFDVLNKFLTKYEIQSKITELVLRMDPIRTIMEISESLKIHVEEFAILIYWLEKVIDAHFFDVFENSLLVASDDDSTQQCLDEFTKSLIHLPHRVANCKSRAKTEQDVENIKIFSQFLEDKFSSTITRTLVLAHSKIGKSESINLTTMSRLVSNGMNISIGSTKLSRFVFKWVCRQGDDADDVKWDRVAQRLFTDESFGAREYEVLVTDVILESESARQLQRCFGSSTNLSPILNRVLTVKMLFQRILAPITIRNIIDFLDVSIVTKILTSAIQVWSSFEFVRSSTIEQQKHTSRLILYIVYVLKNREVDGIWQETFQWISEGVQNRLSKSDVELRQTGMVISEVVSQLNLREMKATGRDVDEKCVLKFDYLDDPWIEEMRRIATNGIVTEKIDSLPSLDCVQQQPPIVELGKNSTSQLDSDDDDDFPTFNVPDEEKNFEKLEKNQEPLKKHEPPKYIADAFEMLVEKEKYEVFEAAFNTIESLVRRNAIGFVQISSNLISRLIFLDNLFSTPNFDAIQKRAIVACLVTRPPCVPIAVNIFLGTSCTMSHRYLILECIRSASKELAEPVEVVVQDEKQAKKSVAEKTWREIVEARIEANTRRFATLARNSKMVENRLGKHVNMFFYPLLVQSTGEHLQLHGRDTGLLSKLIYTITEIYLNAGMCPSIATMSTSLIQYVTPSRFSDDPHVRIAVMFAFCAVVDTLKLEHVEAIFEKSILTDWAKWAAQVAGDLDAHEHERKLAECLLSQIWKKLNASS